MEWNLIDISEDGQQTSQKPGVQRWMRVSAHVDHPPQKGVLRMIRMQRIDLCMLGSVKVVDIVALNRLTEEWKAHRQHE